MNDSMQHVELTHARLSTFLLEMSRVVASQRGNGNCMYVRMVLHFLSVLHIS